VTSGQSVVLSDGTLVVPCCARQWKPTFEIQIRRSTNGGESYSDEQSVVKSDYRKGAYSIMPMMAADPGSKIFKDRLYLVWSQRTANDERVLMSLSKNKGLTWSMPIVLSEQSANEHYDAVLPAVAVNRHGTVAVSWYDSRDSNGGQPRTNVRLRASLDGGTTWLPGVRVTDVPSPIELNEPVRVIGPGYSHLGDTAGLAGDAAGDFHPIWADKRTGVLQLFTATVSVKR
jgi:hypothetical protein